MTHHLYTHNRSGKCLQYKETSVSDGLETTCNKAQVEGEDGSGMVFQNSNLLVSQPKR